KVTVTVIDASAAPSADDLFSQLTSATNGAKKTADDARVKIERDKLQPLVAESKTIRAKCAEIHAAWLPTLKRLSARQTMASLRDVRVPDDLLVRLQRLATDAAAFLVFVERSMSEIPNRVASLGVADLELRNYA